jgi:transposase-like protein
LRERAARLVRASGRPIADVAEDLGINREALRLWVRQAEAGRGERSERLTSGEMWTLPDSSGASARTSAQASDEYEIAELVS